MREEGRDGYKRGNYPEGENDGFEMAISLWGIKDEYELVDGKYVPIVSLNEN